jgi:hypothetical protein
VYELPRDVRCLRTHPRRIRPLSSAPAILGRHSSARISRRLRELVDRDRLARQLEADRVRGRHVEQQRVLARVLHDRPKLCGHLPRMLGKASSVDMGRLSLPKCATTSLQLRIPPKPEDRDQYLGSISGKNAKYIRDSERENPSPRLIWASHINPGTGKSLKVVVICSPL